MPHAMQIRQMGGSMMDAAYPIGFIGLGTMGEAMAAVLKAIEARSDPK
jgi:hypothetical protein